MANLKRLFGAKENWSSKKTISESNKYVVLQIHDTKLFDDVSLEYSGDLKEISDGPSGPEYKIPLKLWKDELHQYIKDCAGNIGDEYDFEVVSESSSIKWDDSMIRSLAESLIEYEGDNISLKPGNEAVISVLCIDEANEYYYAVLKQVDENTPKVTGVIGEYKLEIDSNGNLARVVDNDTRPPRTVSYIAQYKIVGDTYYDSDNKEIN